MSEQESRMSLDQGSAIRPQRVWIRSVWFLEKPKTLSAPTVALVVLN